MDIQTFSDPYHPPEATVPYGLLVSLIGTLQVVGLKGTELERNLLLIGNDRKARRSVLKWLSLSLAKAGESLVFIGQEDLEEIYQTVRTLVPERQDDLYWLDYTSENQVPYFNPLSLESSMEIEESLIWMLDAFEPLEFKGGLELPLIQALIALAQANLRLPDPELKLTLRHLKPFTENQDFRKLVMHFVEEEEAKKIFAKDKLELDLKPLTNFLSTIETSKSLSKAFAQPLALSLNRMGARPLLFIKLSRGRSVTKHFLGSMLLSQLARQREERWLVADNIHRLLHPEHSFYDQLAKGRCILSSDGYASNKEGLKKLLKLPNQLIFNQSSQELSGHHKLDNQALKELKDGTFYSAFESAEPFLTYNLQEPEASALSPEPRLMSELLNFEELTEKILAKLKVQVK